MKAQEIRDHCQEVANWVNWDATCDHFLHGDPETEVTGLACAWTATNVSLRQAADLGCNMFITHEPVFFPRKHKGHPKAEQVAQMKRDLADELGMAVFRCHDTWDRFPEIGIPDAWGTFLGFETEPRDPMSFYKICKLGGVTVEEAAQKVLEKVKTLNQETVLVFGDRTKTVHRMGIGTGAICNMPDMLEMEPDILLVTDDAFGSPPDGLMAADLDIPVLIVNHAVAEKPGMELMPGYFAEQFPGLKTEYIDNAEFPYSIVR